MKNFIGSHLVYVFENGWEYELNIKNENTIDYRIHSGMVGGRWVKDQKVDLIKLSEGVFKLSWTEPTGSDAVVNVMPELNCVHGMIFFPKWVTEHPEITVCYQNDHLNLMIEARKKYDTYPKTLVSKMGKIIFAENAGINNNNVIAIAPYKGMIEDIIAGKELIINSFDTSKIQKQN